MVIINLTSQAAPGGVVAYPVMQKYGSLALEDNLEIGEVVQGRCSISCVCTRVF